MKTLILFLFCILSINSYSQEINFEWNKILGNTGKTDGLSIAIDSAGFIYVAGSFEGSIAINGNTLTAINEKDGYLLKLDSVGNLIWSKQFSSNYNVTINAIKIDKENNLLVLGNYKVQVKFDTTTITTNNTDTLYSSNLFLAKFQPNGDLVWSKNTGGISYSGNALSIDYNNNILLTGKSITVDLFDTNDPINTLDSIQQPTYPSGYHWEYFHPSNGFIAKYAPNGSLMWIKKTAQYPQEIIADYNNNVIITGYFMGESATFDALTIPKIGFETTFLAQYSPTGTINWVKTCGGSSNHNSGYSLAIDSNNNVYQGGRIAGNSITINGFEILPFAGVDAFLMKYDANGNFIWHHLIGTPTTMNGESNYNNANALKIDDDGNILLLGYFMDTLVLNLTELKSNGAPDLMLLKYDPSGNVLSAAQYTDYGWVNGTDLVLDKRNNIYITGSTTLSSWDFNLPSYSFIAKIDKAIPTSPLGLEDNIESTLQEIILYPNPSNGMINIISSESIQEMKIQVFSIDGVKIKEYNQLSSSKSFEINQTGIYIVLITVKGHQLAKKIIVE